MARQLRLEYPGAVYHVTSRGNARNPIFSDDADRNNLLLILEGVVRRCNWLCHAYCLMDNHYHLMIETPEGNLSKGMRQLNGVYTQTYNKRHSMVGHVFQGRFKAIIVEKESYLLELCRYIVLNPVKVNLIKKPELWPWSSYAATIGRQKTPEFLTTGWLLSQFGNSAKESRQRYKQFVADGIAGMSPWEDLVGQIFLGREGFVENLETVLTERKAMTEIPREQRNAARPALQALIDKDMSRETKNYRIYQAYSQHGYTLKEIANYLEIHYATVSRALKMAEQEMWQRKT